MKDRTGLIEAVNVAWMKFLRDNPGYAGDEKARTLFADIFSDGFLAGAQRAMEYTLEKLKEETA